MIRESGATLYMRTVKSKYNCNSLIFLELPSLSAANRLCIQGHYRRFTNVFSFLKRQTHTTHPVSN